MTSQDRINAERRNLAPNGRLANMDRRQRDRIIRGMEIMVDYILSHRSNYEALKPAQITEMMTASGYTAGEARHTFYGCVSVMIDGGMIIADDRREDIALAAFRRWLTERGYADPPGTRDHYSAQHTPPITMYIYDLVGNVEEWQAWNIHTVHDTNST